MSIFFIIGLIIILFFIVFSGIYSIRYYDFKEIFFKILAMKYGIKKVVYIKNINQNSLYLINKVFQLEIKGKFIEYNIAIPAWKPILSLESVDGDQWKIIKNNFIYFISKFNKNPYYLENNIKDYTNRYIISNVIIDSKIISLITLKSFCKYLFNIEISDIESETLYLGSLEWRKEIALKGKGNMEIKNNCIQILLNLIRLNQNIYSIFNENWSKPEYYSVIAQPFIISPMINVSDIMSNAQILLSNSLILASDEVNTFLIDKIIYSYHPFPILERYDPKTSTQYFIPLDSLTNFNNFNEKTRKIVFGSGVRKCAGQNYAYIIIKNLLILYFNNKDKFNPMLNHKYSGRNNDNFNFQEILYMGKILFKLLIT